MSGFRFKNKTARNNFRPVNDDPGLLIKGQGHGYEAFLRQHAPFSQHTASNVADTLAVDQHPPGGDTAVKPTAGFVKFDDLAIFCQENVFFGNTHFICQPRMQD